MKWGAIVFAVIALVAGAWYLTQSGNEGRPAASEKPAELPGDAIAFVSVPATFSQKEQIGSRAYDAVCAACHGENAQGKQGVAPPLVHKIYETNHHGDMSFVLAAQNGVRAHHWRFGNMPAVKGVTQEDVLDVVAYVRALQRENGIK
ncbi:c-type cytochrome [Roseovarius arcticus]|uniref:c-type cytochrome n=1 Tax=Roseovarius arcticus TaxID=2547404 RepID=UPI00111008AE|nr:cytochrome c [Roseovarius arcticus]